MKLGHRPKFQMKLHIPRRYTFFLSQGVEIELMFALRATVTEIRAHFQNCHIWVWNLALGQSSRSCTYTLFLPHGVELSLIFALWAAVSEIRVNFENCHIWAWILNISQSSRSCTYTLFLLKEGEIELIFALRAAVSEIWANFENCHIWAWNLAIGLNARSCTYTIFLAQAGQNWAHFRYPGSGFRDKGQFWKLPYFRMKLGHWPKFQKLHIYSLPTPGGGGSKLSLFSL